MGTEEAKHLQGEIIALLKKLGWSQKRLGREIYFSKHDDEDESEILRMEEKVKKALSRPTTKPELLEQFRMVISNHDEFKKSRLISPHYVSSGVLDPNFEKEIQIISKSITKHVKSSGNL